MNKIFNLFISSIGMSKIQIFSLLFFVIIFIAGCASTKPTTEPNATIKNETTPKKSEPTTQPTPLPAPAPQPVPQPPAEPAQPKCTDNDCPDKHGCDNGECVELVQKCEDSDGGKNTTAYGQTKVFGTTDVALISKDKCASETTLTEYYCEGVESKSANIACTADQICKEGKCMAKPKPEPPPAPPDQYYETESGKLIKIMDKFDGNSINKTRYSVATIGKGASTQDSKITMNGTAKNSIIWNVLYTNDLLNLKKKFTFSVDIDLKDIPPVEGDAMAIIGMEEKKIASSGQQSGSYCEVSISPQRTILRLQSNEAGISGHGGGGGEHAPVQAYEEVYPTKGKLTLVYDPEYRTMTCTFNGKQMSTDVKSTEGDYVLTLRSGLHTISGGGIESEGSGSFIATFDNLNLTTK